MYLDAAYIAKYYVNEADSPQVKEAIRKSSYVTSSYLAVIEVSCVFRRKIREGRMSNAEGAQVEKLLQQHVKDDVWELIPLSLAVLRRTTALIQAIPASVYLRAGDAIHLASALEAGEPEIWTNDRHLLLAANFAGLQGKSVTG